MIKGVLIATLLVVWLIAGVSLTSGFVAGSAEQLALPLWAGLVAWATGTLVIIISLIWVIVGAQTALFNDGALIVGQRIGPVKIGRPKAYAKADIQNIRIQERISGYKGKTVTSHAIVFEYRGETEVLFTRLSRQRAEFLLKGQLREFAWTPGRQGLR